MPRPRMWSLLLLLAACDARIAGAPNTDPPVDAAIQTADPDGGMQSPPPDAAPLGAWGPPAKLTVAAVAGKDEDDETLSSNGLEMIFAIVNPNQNNQKELFWTKRDSAASTTWSTPQKLAFNAGDSETPRFSPDNLTLYFASSRNTTDGTLDIFQVQRAAAGTDTWGSPAKVTGVNSAVTEKWYMQCPVKGSDDYLMVKDFGNNKGTHLVEGKLGAQPAPVPELDGADATSETGTLLSADCLTLYFASTRSGRAQLYTSKRAAIGMPWSKPTVDADYPITGTTTDNQEDPWMASDLRTFVFVSNAGGDKDVYISTR